MGNRLLSASNRHCKSYSGLETRLKISLGHCRASSVVMVAVQLDFESYSANDTWETVEHFGLGNHEKI